MRVQFQDPHGLVEVDSAAHVVRFARTDVPYSTPEEIESSYRDVARALDAVGRPTHALIVDLRLAPGTNTPNFEEAMARARKRLFQGFARVAIIVRTATGVLQVQRHVREDGVEARVFQDESAAVSFAYGRN